MDRPGHSPSPRTPRAAPWLAVLLVLALGACGDDEAEAPPPAPPPIGLLDLPGSYTATTFTITTDMEADVLVAGGELALTMEADFSTSGRLFIPAGTAGMEEALDLSLEGEWDFNSIARVVTLDVNEGPPTFLDAVALQPERAAGTIQLSGDVTEEGRTVRVVLRQG